MREKRGKPCQRQHPRISTPLSIQIDAVNYGAVDWSAGGFRIKSWQRKDIYPGETLDCDFKLHFQYFDVAFNVSAILIRICENSDQIAARFVDLNSRQAELLSTFTEELIEGYRVPIINRLIPAKSPSSTFDEGLDYLFNIMTSEQGALSEQEVSKQEASKKYQYIKNKISTNFYTRIALKLSIFALFIFQLSFFNHHETTQTTLIAPPSLTSSNHSEIVRHNRSVVNNPIVNSPVASFLTTHYQNQLLIQFQPVFPESFTPPEITSGTVNNFTVSSTAQKEKKPVNSEIFIRYGVNFPKKRSDVFSI